MKMTQRNGGITLIALVLTIIVLLILAGVSIATLTGPNGLITRANDAKTETGKAGAKEKVQVEVAASYDNSGNLSKDMLNKNLENIEGITGTPIENFPATVVVDGYEVTIDANGVISDKGTGGGNTPSGEEISKSESYVGYYADIDGDKNIDGIIYADLAVGGSGTWNSDSWSSYEYAKVAEGLKSYSISSENGTGFGNWEKPIITAKEGTTGKDRFYVMALEDFNPGTSYCWYNAAYGKLDNLVGNTTNDFGQGKTKTTTMIAEWNKGENGKYGAQDARDMWGVIQKADSAGKTWDLSKWFVPSKAEWAAFGDMTYTKIGLTTSNYGNCGLESYYWSAAQDTTNYAYSAYFNNGYMGSNDVNGSYYVRLSATF